MSVARHSSQTAAAAAAAGGGIGFISSDVERFAQTHLDEMERIETGLASVTQGVLTLPLSRHWGQSFTFSFFRVVKSVVYLLSALPVHL